jgi:hypothetical protein
MTAPERLVPRVVTVYDRERLCVAPGCGEWFQPRVEHQRWCSDACRQAAFQAGRRGSNPHESNRVKSTGEQRSDVPRGT